MDLTFCTDDWRAYRMAECRTYLYDTGVWAVAQGFLRIAQRGLDRPRHASVGRFRSEDVPSPNLSTPCYLPWTFIEPEAGDLVDNLQATREVLEILHSEGYDTTRMHLRYSGNKSFWLALPATLMGHPVGPVSDQKALRQRVFLPLLQGLRVDENLWDARQMHRLLGSIHEHGGPCEVLPFDALRSPERFAYHLGFAPDYRVPLPLEGPDPLLLQRCLDKLQFHVPPMDTVPRDLQGHNFMARTEDGVTEGDRNWTAFRRACVLWERHGQRMAWQHLQDWNQKNDPPLPERELQQCFRSARRTVTSELTSRYA